jgi:hypothetical protein
VGVDPGEPGSKVSSVLVDRSEHSGSVSPPKWTHANAAPLDERGQRQELGRHGTALS